MMCVAGGAGRRRPGRLAPPHRVLAAAPRRRPPQGPGQRRRPRSACSSTTPCPRSAQRDSPGSTSRRADWRRTTVPRIETAPMTQAIVARAPGRVNLIGDHTDYTGGLCLPMAIDRWVEVAGQARSCQPASSRLRSDAEAERRRDPPRRRRGDRSSRLGSLRRGRGPAARPRPRVRRCRALRPADRCRALLECRVGGGDSSCSRGRRARSVWRWPCCAATPSTRHAVSRPARSTSWPRFSASPGTPCSSTAPTNTVVADHRCHPPTRPRSSCFAGRARELAGTGYADRVDECRRVEEAIGPLRHGLAWPTVERIADPTRAPPGATRGQRERDGCASSRRRSRPVTSRTPDGSWTPATASLRDDYESSTPTIDALCADLRAMPGVFGARITGGGWGGGVVALTRPGRARRPGLAGASRRRCQRRRAGRLNPTTCGRSARHDLPTTPTDEFQPRGPSKRS